MLEIVTFGHNSNLTSVNLTSMDTNMEAGIVDDMGMLSGTIWREWAVVTEGEPTGSSYFFFIERVIVENAVQMDGGQDDSWVDYTSPSRSASVTPTFPYNGSSDDPPWGWVSGDRIYFGCREIFDGLYFTQILTAGATVSPTWQYWNATTGVWAGINDPGGGPTDNTTGFDVTPGAVYWDSSAGGGNDTPNWGKTSLAVANSNPHADDDYLYWVRVQVGNANNIDISSVVRADSAGARVSRANELLVEAADPVMMGVMINRGIAHVDGRLVVLPYKTSTNLVAPSANKWYAAIQIDKDGDIVVDYGPIAASPIEQSARVDALKLADVLIDTADTTIVAGDITDMRNMLT